MPENKSKKDKNDAPRLGDTAAAGERFDLDDVLAVGGDPVALPIVPNNYEPVPISFLGVDYAIGRRYTGSTVREFFALMRVTGTDRAAEVLDIVLTDGDPNQLWSDISPLSIYESNKLFEAIYKIAGLMNLSGKFLAS
ncbi:hypothetical protein [Rhodococcus sp. 14-2470-1a]|uniref:hypothetical protein n=1 Tax=Rhodococcus sp. 14-2470-1a TaxID=2023150 RepID=UPI000B9BEDA6|nr:hypothetical protein [Rhodococcus sp. 14-2470-1a]OZF47572.1 hypothetical protein CH292_19305 [Rhodococcus sp. 14-2470-1a]